MQRESLENKVVAYLQKEYPNWIPKGQLLLIEFKDKRGVRYMADTLSRKARNAEESSRIAVKYDGSTTLYKFIPYHMRGRYIPTSQRHGKELFKKV